MSGPPNEPIAADAPHSARGSGLADGPRVSVCIPSYNYAHYIGGCIESVLAQTFDGWELVVVDNASTDATEEVIKGFDDARIRFHRNDRNLGIVGNWRRCVRLARGEYVGILPADDLYLPRMLERSVAALDAHPSAGLVHSSYVDVDDAAKVLRERIWWPEDRLIPGLDAVRRLVMGCYITPASVIMRRASYERAGGFDARYRFEVDWALWLRIALAEDLAYIAEPLAARRHLHPGSVSAQKLLRDPHLRTAEDLRLLEEIFRRLPPLPDRRALHRRARKHLMNRHVARTLDLLHGGDGERFRQEVTFALRNNGRFPAVYRKIMVLWLASFLSTSLAQRLEAVERRVWRRVTGENGDVTFSERDPLSAPP